MKLKLKNVRIVKKTAENICIKAIKFGTICGGIALGAAVVEDILKKNN